MDRRTVGLPALALLVLAVTAPADAGRQSPSLSFFSGGGGAHADWLHTDDQPAGDTDGQAIRIVTTTTGYAGADVKHAEGMLTASYPSSSFDFKASLAGPSLGYPRLVYRFSDGGDAMLRPLTWTAEWQTVADPNWDNRGGTCGATYQQTWQQVQDCHVGTTVTSIFFATDPGVDVEFRVDNLRTAGKTISSAADNAA